MVKGLQAEAEREDDFLVTLDGAARHILYGESPAVWREEFEAVLRHVQAWAQEHAGMMSRCVAILKTGRVRAFVVPSAGRFDCDLADSTAQLNLKLVGVSQLVDSHVMQVSDMMAADAAGARGVKDRYELLAVEA